MPDTTDATSDTPSPFADLMPSGPHAYLIPAWLGCLRWALGNDEIMAAFRAETGNTWTPGRSGLEVAIDRATGAEATFFRAFAKWVNENLWGDPDGEEEDTP